MKMRHFFNSPLWKMRELLVILLVSIAIERASSLHADHSHQIPSPPSASDAKSMTGSH